MKEFITLATKQGTIKLQRYKKEVKEKVLNREGKKVTKITPGKYETIAERKIIGGKMPDFSDITDRKAYVAKAHKKAKEAKEAAAKEAKEAEAAAKKAAKAEK